ncbi:MAG: branched-chain amino acid ABC transporter permease [Candidatus Verstraetearchaeota archaeon]|nr:branched-chain amino acid ABC transporter permease [Candidatus Verstraetearchaeota archaeon]
MVDHISKYFTSVNVKQISIFLLVIFMLVLPHFASPYFVSFFALLFMYIAISQCWNIFSGYTGYWSMGHQVFLGVGAYTMAILVTKFNYYDYFVLPICGVMAILTAILFAITSLRLRGSYFTIYSIAFAEIFKIIALNLDWLTGGGQGILLPPVYKLYDFYYQMLVMVIVVSGVAYFIKRSPFGYALFAIKDDEDAAEAVGIKTFLHKVVILSLSGFFLGIIGGLYAEFLTYIDPYVAFADIPLLVAILSAIMGGLGEVSGPILGALIYVPIMEYLWISFPYVYLIILGFSLVLIIRFIPDGILSYIPKIQQVFSYFKSKT